MNDDVASVGANSSRYHRPLNIKLRLNIPARDEEHDDGCRGRAGTTGKRTTTSTTSAASRENSMSMSMGASMSLGEHGDECGDEATQGVSFLSPPPNTGRQKRHTHSPATTPMSVGTSPRMPSKRPRISNDWVEDEVHPSMVSGGTVGKRLTSELMASNLSQLLSVSPMSIHNDGVPPCAVGESWTSETVKSSPSLLKRTLSGTYMDTVSGMLQTAPKQLTKSPTESMMMSHHGGNGLPPSSPSDPSPIHDLRKAALMRSRLLNVSTLNVSSVTLPPRGNNPQRGFVQNRPCTGERK